MNKSLWRARSVILVAVLSLVAAACSSGGSPSSSSSTAAATPPDVLHMAFATDMSDPDPDIFYYTEGNAIVDNVYDDLVQYASNDSYTLVPDLAESWTISPDGKTYTFQLRPDVHFHTGGVMTSQDVLFSFERRNSTKVNSPMEYLTDNIAGYSTPSPLTFVVHLDKPEVYFLSNLASPYGLKVISKAAVLAHQVNGDLGQKWLMTHDAGTGPFTITTFDPEYYVLTRFDQYWGPLPQLKAVDISVIPNATTQLLELESGQLNLIIHGLTVAELNQLSTNPKYQVDKFFATFKEWATLNTHTQLSSDAERQAIAEAINRALITQEVYGSYAQPAKDFYIPGEVPAGDAPDNPTYDPSALKALVPSLPAQDKNVSIVYTTDDAIPNEQVAEIIQTELEAAGLNATVTGVPLSNGFLYWGQSPTQDPDIMVVDGNPDSGNADDYARPFIGTVGVGNDGSLNGFHCTIPGVDAQLNQAMYTTDLAQSMADYVKVGNEAVQQECQMSLAQLDDTITADAGYHHIDHQIATVWSIRFGDITIGNG